MKIVVNQDEVKMKVDFETNEARVYGSILRTIIYLIRELSDQYVCSPLDVLTSIEVPIKYELIRGE